MNRVQNFHESISGNISGTHNKRTARWKSSQSTNTIEIKKLSSVKFIVKTRINTSAVFHMTGENSQA